MAGNWETAVRQAAALSTGPTRWTVLGYRDGGARWVYFPVVSGGVAHLAKQARDRKRRGPDYRRQS